MPRRSRSSETFTTIHIEGTILPPDLLRRVAENDKDLGGIAPSDYHLAAGDRLTEIISQSWNRLQADWSAFRKAVEAIHPTEIGTGLTRDRWLMPLFRELGYGRVPDTRAIQIGDRAYPVSHAWCSMPIHFLSFRAGLDDRLTSVGGSGPRISAHGLLQDFLNASDAHLWGVVSNGRHLRVLRDNTSLTRQAFVEFDLESMMQGEVYSDFVILWLLLHQSRVEGDRPAEFWLEKWSRLAHDLGARALDQLRDGVQGAIETLGRGFLDHPANRELRDDLEADRLDKQEFYRQLLRLVYRLLFLLVAESRGLLLIPEALPSVRDLYDRHYSITRLRRLAERHRGTRHADLYAVLRLVLSKMDGAAGGCPELGIPALGGFLFSADAMPHLANADISNAELLAALRSLAFVRDRAGVLRPVDFKNLRAEEMGSVYESLLELHPELHLGTAGFTLRFAAGNERKTTGSYYTPESLVQCLLDSALEPVLNRAVAKPDPERALLELKICDPACGSGHFLVAAAHRIAHRLAAVRAARAEGFSAADARISDPSPAALRGALRDVVGHCLFGVDLNPMSVELCKVALWMEAVEPGKPLSFLDHHIQVGNSLLGATPHLLFQGIPDAAFIPLEGDDKEFIKAWRKKNREERPDDYGQVQETFLTGSGTVAADQGLRRANTIGREVDDLSDATSVLINEKQERWEGLVSSEEYADARLWADAWCAAFVWKKRATPELPHPITNSLFRELGKCGVSAVPDWMHCEIRRLADQYRFLHWHLAFPTVFHLRDDDTTCENESTGWSGGFDCVLGNPPWERVKLQEKEWFAGRDPQITEASNAAERKKLILQLATHAPALWHAWKEDSRQAEGESALLRNTGRYPLCGCGDVNTFAVFAEDMRQLTSTSGAVGVVIPASIATADTTKRFFGSLMSTGDLRSFYAFREIRQHFLDTDSRESFVLLSLLRGNPANECPAEFVFDALTVDELREPHRLVRLSAEDIALVNPNTGTCPIFRSARDAEISKELYRRIPVLIREGEPEGNPWGISFLRMFDMANDSGHFSTREQLQANGFTLEGNHFIGDGESWLPLYEAKMIHHYDHRFGDYADKQEDSESTALPAVPSSRKADPTYAPVPRYWVRAREVAVRIGNRQNIWLVGFRDVCRSTDERTCIGTFTPAYAVGHKFPLYFLSTDATVNACFVAQLASFVFDYAARQKLGGTSMTYFTLKQLPTIHPAWFHRACFAEQFSISWSNWILPRVMELTYTAHDLAPFALDCGYDGPPFRWDDERRFLLRCELDAAFFHLYGISRDNADYILETFPIVKRKDIAAHGTFRTKETILQIYDALAQAATTEIPYPTVLDPPPADPKVAHPISQIVMSEFGAGLEITLFASDSDSHIVPAPGGREEFVYSVLPRLVERKPGLRADFYMDAAFMLTEPSKLAVLAAINETPQRRTNALQQFAQNDRVRLPAVISALEQTLVIQRSGQELRAGDEFLSHCSSWPLGPGIEPWLLPAIEAVVSLHQEPAGARVIEIQSLREQLTA